MTPTRERKIVLAAFLTCLGGFAVHFLGDQAFGAVFPLSHLSVARHALLDWGWPSWFVCGYVTFAHLQVPYYAILALFALCIGLAFDERNWGYALMLCLWTLMADVITTAIRGAQSSPSDPMGVLLCPGVAVAAFLALPIGMTGWAIGLVIRKCLGRRPQGPEQADAGAQPNHATDG